MYLIEFDEISKEVIWGGNSLSTVYSKPFDKDKTIGALGGRPKKHESHN